MNVVFELDGTPHDEGDPDCQSCWSNYPKKCHCGGLLHAAFGDENYDGDYWLYYLCDKCGRTEDIDE